MSRTLPEGFVSMIEGLSFGPMASLPDVLAATEPSVAVRANAGKGIEAPEGEPVAWLPGTGRYLGRRPQFTLDPLFHQGGYYVQDASSMFIGHAVRQLTAGRGPVSYLDACAAPGGKTTRAAARRRAAREYCQMGQSGSHCDTRRRPLARFGGAYVRHRRRRRPL